MPRIQYHGPAARYYAHYLWDAFYTIQDTDRSWNEDNVYLIPLQVNHTVTVDRIICFNGSAATGARMMAIYADNGGTPVGGALIVATAGTAATAVSAKQEITIANTQLTLGLYWLAILWDANGDKFIMYLPPAITGGTLTGHAYYLAYPGPFTDPCPATSVPTYAPILGVRVASIP